MRALLTMAAVAGLALGGCEPASSGSCEVYRLSADQLTLVEEGCEGTDCRSIVVSINDDQGEVMTVSYDDANGDAQEATYQLAWADSVSY